MNDFIYPIPDPEPEPALEPIIITNKIYARTDPAGIVTRLFSSVSEAPLDGDVLIEEGNEDHHAYVHLKYQLTDDAGRYNYRIVDGQFEIIPEEDKPPAPEPPEPLPTATELVLMEALAEVYEMLTGGEGQ
jgi:hypothetical protein